MFCAVFLGYNRAYLKYFALGTFENLCKSRWHWFCGGGGKIWTCDLGIMISLLKIIEQSAILIRINRVHSINQTLNLRTSKHQKTNFFESTLNVSFLLKPLLTLGFIIWDYSHSIIHTLSNSLWEWISFLLGSNLVVQSKLFSDIILVLFNSIVSSCIFP